VAAREILVQPERKEIREPLALKVTPGQPVRRATRGIPGQRDRKAILEQLAVREIRVIPGLQAVKEHKAILARKETRVILEVKEHKATQELRVIPEHKVILAPAFREIPAHRGQPEQPATREIRVLKAFKVIPALLVLKEPRVILVLLVAKVTPVLREIKAILEVKGRRVIPEPKAILAFRAFLAETASGIISVRPRPTATQGQAISGLTMPSMALSRRSLLMTLTKTPPIFKPGLQLLTILQAQRRDFCGFSRKMTPLYGSYSKSQVQPRRLVTGRSALITLIIMVRSPQTMI
jgi:hypothetical protein